MNSNSPVSSQELSDTLADENDIANLNFAFNLKGQIVRYRRGKPKDFPEIPEDSDSQSEQRKHSVLNCINECLLYFM